MTHLIVCREYPPAPYPAGGGAGASVQASLQKRIPRELRPRFHFHGSRRRASLLEALSRTSIAVVPSRWENFPFTCIEAMSTGLPVLASPNGGMAEMIVAAESGWMAASQSANDLGAALQRALATPASKRAAMGARAAESIRQLCDNDVIVARQIAFRERVAAQSTQSHQIDQDQSFPLLCDAIFAVQPRIGLIAPWVLRRGKRPDLDPGPCPVSFASIPDEPLPPGAAIRPEILAAHLHPTWSTLRDGGWTAITYPGPPMTELPTLARPRHRYSGMALIANQSAAFALQWMLAAPFSEKLRWLARVAANPKRLVGWLAWRIRSIFTSAQR